MLQIGAQFRRLLERDPDNLVVEILGAAVHEDANADDLIPGLFGEGRTEL